MSEEYFKKPNKPIQTPTEERKLRTAVLAKMTALVKELTTDELIDAYTYMVSLSKKANTQP